MNTDILFVIWVLLSPTVFTLGAAFFCDPKAKNTRDDAKAASMGSATIFLFPFWAMFFVVLLFV
jgi:hypothetical protein